MHQLVAAGPHRLSKQWLARSWRSLNTLFRRAGSIEVPLGPRPPPPHRGGLGWRVVTNIAIVVYATRRRGDGAQNYDHEHLL